MPKTPSESGRPRCFALLQIIVEFENAKDFEHLKELAGEEAAKRGLWVASVWAERKTKDSLSERPEAADGM